jgi:hypothetical protein
MDKVAHLKTLPQIAILAARQVGLTKQRKALAIEAGSAAATASTGVKRKADHTASGRKARLNSGDDGIETPAKKSKLDLALIMWGFSAKPQLAGVWCLASACLDGPR